MRQTALAGNGFVLCLNTVLLCRKIARKLVAGVQVNNAQTYISIYRISLNNVFPYIMSSLEYYPPFYPKYSHNQCIKLENLQIVSPSENVKINNVLGHY